MKKIFIICALFSMTSCATLLGGQKTDHQRKQPNCNEPRRRVRIGLLVADLVLFPPGVLIDFATRKIYRPLPNPEKLKTCK